MTRSQPHGDGIAASGGAEGVRGRGGEFEARKSPSSDREQWKFTGRETLWGYTYLVWTLTANPTRYRKVGERYARVQL